MDFIFRKAKPSILLFLGTLLLLVVFLSAVPKLQTLANSPTVSTPPSWDWLKSCKIMQADDKNRDESCRFGSGTPEIILFGDSHAAAASKTIVRAALANEMSIEVFSFGGCRFTLVEEIEETSGASCFEHNHNLKKHILKIKPRIIVYVHKGPESKTDGLSENKNSLKSLRELKVESATLKLVVVGTVPTYQFSDTLLKTLISDQPRMTSTPIEDNHFWKSQLVQDGETFISSTDKLCSKSCSPKNNNKWLYEDQHHLNQRGYSLFYDEFLLALK
jgi:hypothetical protein